MGPPLSINGHCKEGYPDEPGSLAPPPYQRVSFGRCPGEIRRGAILFPQCPHLAEGPSQEREGQNSHGPPTRNSGVECSGIEASGAPVTSTHLPSLRRGVSLPQEVATIRA